MRMKSEYSQFETWSFFSIISCSCGSLSKKKLILFCFPKVDLYCLQLTLLVTFPYLHSSFYSSLAVCCSTSDSGTCINLYQLTHVSSPDWHPPSWTAADMSLSLSFNTLHLKLAPDDIPVQSTVEIEEAVVYSVSNFPYWGESCRLILLLFTYHSGIKNWLGQRTSQRIMIAVSWLIRYNPFS